MGSKRVNVKAILADADLRRKLMVSTIQATQAREGIDTTTEQADRAYYIVSEGEKSAFFGLEAFKGGKRGERDRRHEMFVRALRADSNHVRYDLARRDFASIDGSPLAYERVGIVAHIFREAPSLDPQWGNAAQGLATAADERFVRYWWEVHPNHRGTDKQWVPFAKGGDFSRFYSDVHLVVRWTESSRRAMEQSGRVQNVPYYFRPGITWPYRTQRGFSPRLKPSGSIHGHVGHSFFPKNEADAFFLLGMLSSVLFEYLVGLFSAFGKFEIGMVKKCPVPMVSAKQREEIAVIASAIYGAKARWDHGNEISTSFVLPWLLSVEGRSIVERLDSLAVLEAEAQDRMQREYRELNALVYRRYGVSENSRAVMDKTMADRPPEILWPQMEGKNIGQKRMEHVWRLLSYAVKRVLEADDDGIVPFDAVNAEPRLVERVRHELAMLLPGGDVNQIEVEIVNELKKAVKGYRKCGSLDEWLENAFFEYHLGLYKGRPIFWHISSAQGSVRFAFGALIHYHRFDKNRMAKLRASYLRDAIEEFRREAGLADKVGRTDDRLDWQAKLEEAQALDKKLQLIQEGRLDGAEGSERDYRILTSWKEPGERPKGWDPDIDDGVKVNIEPFEKAGVLRLGKVT